MPFLFNVLINVLLIIVNLYTSIVTLTIIFQEIMNKIVENHRKVGKELRIENFAWRPPGYPLGRYFADSLDTCHYTCILVSK